MCVSVCVIAVGDSCPNTLHAWVNTSPQHSQIDTLSDAKRTHIDAYARIINKEEEYKELSDSSRKANILMETQTDPYMETVLLLLLLLPYPDCCCVTFTLSHTGKAACCLSCGTKQVRNMLKKKPLNLKSALSHMVCLLQYLPLSVILTLLHPYLCFVYCLTACTYVR